MTLRDQPDRSLTLDRTTMHLLGNHLAVIVGFVEMMIADVAPDDPRRSDLMEVRAAAVEAAKLLSPPDGET